MHRRRYSREASLAIGARAIAVLLFFVAAGLARRPAAAAAALVLVVPIEGTALRFGTRRSRRLEEVTKARR